MSATGKTPVSILSEMLVQKKMQPIFNLLMSGAGTNQGLFIYEVSAGNIVKARGQGRSKKEAKQDAAKAALEKLKIKREGNSLEVHDEDELPVPSLEVVSPYSTDFKVNAVGQVGEFCASSELPAPTYDLIREDGPPHDKTFEFACKVLTFEFIGIGRTKQQAKQKAANTMLETLQKIRQCDMKPKLDIPAFQDFETPEEREELLEAIRAERKARGLASDKATTSLLGRQTGSRIKHEWTPEKLKEVENLRVSTTRYLAQLQKICEQLDLTISYRGLKSSPAGDKVRVVSLSTKPEISFIGRGKSGEDADNKAALRALEFFDVIVFR